MSVTPRQPSGIVRICQKCLDRPAGFGVPCAFLEHLSETVGWVKGAKEEGKNEQGLPFPSSGPSHIMLNIVES